MRYHISSIFLFIVTPLFIITRTNANVPFNGELPPNAPQIVHSAPQTHFFILLLASCLVVRANFTKYGLNIALMCTLIFLFESAQAQLYPLSWRWLSQAPAITQYGLCGAAGQFSQGFGPGSRNAASMTSNGDTYLMGGYGFSTTTGPDYLGDIWTFRQAEWNTIGEWAWLGGPHNITGFGGVYNGSSPHPGGRFGSAVWFSDSLYIHAGSGIDGIPNANGWLNDLWSFNVSSFDFRWLGGSSVFRQVAVFGSKGVPNPDNVPGAVVYHRVLASGSGETLIFGGRGYDASLEGNLADAWKYSGNEWTWINGPSMRNVYSACCGADSHPGGRYDMAVMPHPSVAYLFGGYGSSASSSGRLGDLWAYNIVANQWTFISGESVATNVTATYGTMGVWSMSTEPGCRFRMNGWTDPNSDLIALFGGSPEDGAQLNDFFVFNTTSTTVLWAWAGGDSIHNANGTFHDGWFSSSNSPGSRQRFAVSVSNGLMLLFGGLGRGIDGTFSRLNDMWATKGPSVSISPTPTPLHPVIWRWVSGSSDGGAAGTCGSAGEFGPLYAPGARYRVAMTSSDNGDVYLFGGVGRDTTGAHGNLADVWLHRQGSWLNKGEWAWLGGHSNAVNYTVGQYSGPTPYPGSRWGSIAWFSNVLYVHGGMGKDGDDNPDSRLNDLWLFNVTSYEWQWLKGSSLRQERASFGALGVSNATNVPGAVRYHTVLKSSHNYTYLFGGDGFTAQVSTGYLSDVWQYNSVNNTWAWISGQSLIDQNAVGGSPGVFSASYRINGRYGHAAITQGNKAYVAMGFGALMSGGGYLNDVWAFDIDKHQWAYIAGDSNVDVAGIYDQRGLFGVSMPGSRYMVSGWGDPNSDQLIHIFGGIGNDHQPAFGLLNDVFSLNVTTREWAWSGGGSVVFENGAYDDTWFSTANKPGARQAFGTAVCNSLMLLFGGSGRPVSEMTTTQLNDLFVTRGPAVVVGPSPTITPSPTTTPSHTPSPTITPSATPTTVPPLHQISWRWLTGSSTTVHLGLCGAAGVFDASFSPGARTQTAMTTEANRVYLMGGHGYNTASGSAHLGDAWIYRQDQWSGKGAWAWIAGSSNEGNYNGKYNGTDPMPGGRAAAVAWFEAPESLYVHGGFGMDSVMTSASYLSDLWVLNTTSFLWSWLKGSSVAATSAVFGVKGVQSISNVPGAVFHHVILASGMVFGGYGLDSSIATGYLADIWGFNRTSWTWLDGPSLRNQGSTASRPCGRYTMSVMRRSNVAFIYGGEGQPEGTVTGNLADMWRYHIRDNEWTFVAGDSIATNVPASHGIMCRFQAGTRPGSRQRVSGWADPNSELIYVAFGYDGSGRLNDVFAFNITIKQWSWVGGSQISMQDGVFDDDWFSTANKPGARTGAGVAVNHEFGLMYALGGYGHASGALNRLNDFWAHRGATIAVDVSPTASPCPTPSPTPTATPSPVPLPIITRIEPPYGPTNGGTGVLIHGHEFTRLGASDSVIVWFGSETVNGVRLDIRHILCVTPSSLMIGNVTVVVKGTNMNATSQFNYYGNLTLSRVYPPLALRTGGQSIVIEGTNLPDTGSYYTIRLGDGIHNVTTGVSSYKYGNQTWFIAPSFAAFYNESTYDVTLDVAPNGQDYVPGQSLPFKYYVMPTLTSITPNQAQTYGGMNATVQGDGFFDSGMIKCRFDGDVSDGYYISSTIIMCLVPKVDEGGIKDLRVSMDDGNVYTSSSVKFIMLEFVSDECRRPGEVTAFRDDRQQLDLFYFPNLAVGAHVTTSSRRDDYDSDVGRSLSPSQLVDGDRCCEYSLQTAGYKCGVVFNVKSSLTELASVTVDIRYPAYVDEVLTTWFRPCKNLPDPGYTIETRLNDTAEWSKLLERSVWKENPCRTLTGDSGPTAFCADFFQPIVAQQFKLTFNNSDEKFLVGDRTDGGWLNEFEVHGIFLKTPYRLYTASPPLSVKSGITVPIPPIVVESLSILDGPMNASDPDVSRPVTVSIQGPQQCLISHPVTSVQGWYNFSSISFTRPMAGIYSVVFSSHGLKSTNATVTVSQGTAASLKATTAQSSAYASADSVTLSTITVKAFDDGSNWCDQDGLQRNITVSAVNSTVLGGVLKGAMINGQVEFSSIKLIKPVTGVHVLSFESSGMTAGLLEVVVGVGAAKQLSLDPYVIDPKPSSEKVNVPTLYVRIRDAGGTFVPTAANQVAVTLIGAGSTLLGNTTLDADGGVAMFFGLQLAAPVAGVYSLKFTADSLQDSPLLCANVTIVPGAAKSIFLHNVTNLIDEYGSAVMTSIEPITIGALDAGGNRVSIDRSVLVHLSPHPELLSGTTIVEMQNGIAIASNLTILSPPSGDYHLNFSIVGLQSTSMDIKIVPGSAVSLRLVSGRNQTHQSVADVPLETYILEAVDAGGSKAPSGGTTDPMITVSCSSATLAGTLSVQMAPNGTVVLPLVSMKAPKSGSYQLVFIASNGLVSATAVVQVTIGPPYRLKYVQPDSSQCNPACTNPGTELCCRSHPTTTMPLIVIKAVDAGGDEVGSRQTNPLQVDAVFTANSTAVWSGNMTVTMQNGEAEFTHLVLHSAKVGRYVIDFAASQLIGVRLSLNIRVGDAAGMVIVSGPTDVPYPCVGNTTLNDVEVQLLDAGGTAITSPSSTVTLALIVRRVDDMGGTPVINTINSNVGTSTGIATWSNLVIRDAPHTGNLTVQITGTLLGATRLVSFIATITNGPAVRFGIENPPIAALKASSSVHIPSMTLVERDAGNNRAAIDAQSRYNVTVTLPDDPLKLAGTTVVEMGGGQAELSNLWLSKPSEKTYKLSIVGNCPLPPIEQSVEVIAGPATHLLLHHGSTVSDNVNALETIVAEMKDGAGNTVRLKDTDSYVIIASCEKCSTLVFLQENVDYETARASFRSIVVRGNRSTTYPLFFHIKDVETVNATLMVEIQPCTQLRPNSVADGENCECPVGYSGKIAGVCTPCASGFYKDEQGNNDCAQCSMTNAISRQGATSAFDCRCMPYTFFNASATDNTRKCVLCDRKTSICPGGNTNVSRSAPDGMGPIYPNTGYWRPSDAMHVWDIMPCPLGAGSMCIGGPNAHCAQNYTGLLCSFCIDDFARQGDVCLKCDPQEWNIVVIIAFVIATFFVARWYVNKQALGGRSPEATILKVLIAFLQTLGFLGGFKARWQERMEAYFSVVGITSTLDAFQWQPIDCGVKNPDYYFKYFEFVALIPLCFIVPMIFYHIGKLPCWQSLMQLRRRKTQAMSAQAKRSLSTRVEQSPSTSTPESSSRICIGITTVFWPVIWFFFSLLPDIPSLIAFAFRRFGASSGPKLNLVKNKICGDHLQVNQAQDMQEYHSQRHTAAVNDATASQVRAQVKSTGGVLFEQDPFAGRSAMSLTKGAFWIMFFFFLPTILKNTMELSNCRQIGQKYYVERDLRVECNTPLHVSIVNWGFYATLIPIVTLLVLYVVYKNVIKRKRRELIPYLSVYNLCWEDSLGQLRLPPGVDEAICSVLRAEKNMLRRLRKYLFLFSGYRSEGVLYMWDLVIMARKVAIAAILVFARQSPVLQIFYSLIVFVAALVLHLVFKPFDDDYAKQKKMPVLPSTLEFVSIVSTIFTLLCGFLFYLEDDGIMSAESLLALDWVLLSFNMVIILAFLYLLFRSIINRVSGRITRFRLRALESRPSQGAAKWWKDKCGCCGWGTREQRSSEVQMTEIKTPVPTPEPTPEPVHLEDSLPDGWEAVVDSNSGRTYYQNRAKKLTQWNRPESEARL